MLQSRICDTLHGIYNECTCMSLTGFVSEDSGRDSAKNSPVVKEIGQVGCLLSVHLEQTWKFQRQ